MKKKILLTGPEARKQVKAGVDRIADAVKLTLGPFGRNFASGVRGGAIRISNDGVSLAKEIEGRNEFEDIGIRAVREAATKTNDAAGDGTTTAVVLTQAILNELAEDPDLVKVGLSPVEMMQKIRDEGALVLAALEGMTKPVESLEEMIAIVKVSVEDTALAELIGTAQWKIGKTGTLLAEEHNSDTDLVEYISGVRIDNGFGTSRFANNQEKMTLELEDMHVLVTTYNFNTAKMVGDLKPLFDQLTQVGTKGVVIIGRAFDETAIGLCMKNIQNGFPLYALNAPYADQDEVMEDLAAILGAKLIKPSERNLDSVQTSDFGMSTKIMASRYEGIVTGQRGTNERIDKLVAVRVQDINEKMKSITLSPFEKRNLETRLSQLSGGTAIIRVGAETEQERKYKKDKVDDAISSAKAAIQEGTVPGAGQALLYIGTNMAEGSILAPALAAPYNQIQKNAGRTIEIPDWVRDPVRVVRIGFQKALSIASSLSTTDILVTVEDDKPMWVQQADKKDESDDE